MLCKTLGVRFLIVVINKMDDPTARMQCLCIWYTYIQIHISWYRVRRGRERYAFDATAARRRAHGAESDGRFICTPADAHDMACHAGQVAARALRRVRLEAQAFLKTCGYIIKKEVRFIPIGLNPVPMCSRK